ncbi:MAG: hypothetical protein QXI77_03125 [Nanopusillaceae archaeon]
MKGVFFENKRILILFFFFSAIFLSISFLYSFSSSSSEYEGYCPGILCNCTGICNRSSVIVYFENDIFIYRIYSDLFSQYKYCKNGTIYEDKKRPSVYTWGLRIWSDFDFPIIIYCDDHDESGCWKYNYKIIRVV